MFKSTKAKIIFVVIFSIICLIITATLVLYKNIDIEDKSDENVETFSEKKINNDISGIDLNGTYNQNDLIIEEKKATQEKAEIRYLQIDGLKNKKIQNKINKEIEYTALNCYKDEIKNLNEIINISVGMTQTANFANAISFELIYTAKIDDDDDGWYQGFKGINYDLTTGEKIFFQELFTSKAPIEDIIRNASYYSLLCSRAEKNLSGDTIISNYGDIENEVSIINHKYKNDKIKEFYFTPSDIIFYYEKDKSVKIEMMKYAEDIAIYNRYLSKDTIFEKNDIGIKNLYTLSTRYSNLYDYSNYQKGDNYFVDIVINYQSIEKDEFAKELLQNKIKDIEEEIEKLKKTVNKDSDKFYILNYYITIYTGKEESMQKTLTSCNEKGNTYEITKEDFEEKIEPIIVEYNRQEHRVDIEDYLYDFSQEIGIQAQEVMEYYDPETSEKIVI